MASTEEAIQTLYVNNLNDKLPKEQLKEELYLLFSQFGTILDVVALKTERMKGQAWISFVTVQNATDATTPKTNARTITYIILFTGSECFSKPCSCTASCRKQYSSPAAFFFSFIMIYNSPISMITVLYKDYHIHMNSL